MTIKEIFDKAENGTLTFDQFESLSKEGNAKFADLSEGKYVSKSKYDDDLGSKDTSISKLNDTIAQRDKDLADLQTKLKDAGTDTSKLAELQTNFDTLQAKYTTDMETYKQQLEEQRYGFAVREFANSKEFSSQAAKRDFVSQLLNEKLKMKGDDIIGAEDFATSYAKDNADAFVTKTETPPAQPTNDSASKPQFVSSTPGTTPQKQPTLTELMQAANDQAR